MSDAAAHLRRFREIADAALKVIDFVELFGLPEHEHAFDGNDYTDAFNAQFLPLQEARREAVRDSRGLGISAALNAPIEHTQFGVFRM